MYDVIIVGARVAGAATGMLLARRGHKVLIVDRAATGTDTLSTHFLHLSGMALLTEWGLADEIKASGCPPLTEARLDLGPFALHGAPAPAGDVTEMFCCRRTVLDPILVRAAQQAGAEVRDRVTVDDLLIEDGTVTGIRGHEGDGAPFVARARMVVGADGLHSVVASKVGAEEIEKLPPSTCAYYGYWSGIDLDHAVLAPRAGVALALMPTNDGLTCVFVCKGRDAFHDFRKDVEGTFRESLQAAPEVAALVEGGRLVERIRGTGDLPNVVRQPWGPGWALVGDAGWHKDPITAQGISDALRDAGILAGAIDEGLTGSADMPNALAAYQAQRDAIEMPRYRFTLMLAALEPPPPPMAEMLVGIAQDPAATSAFLGLFAGTTPFETFFPAPADAVPVSAHQG